MISSDFQTKIQTEIDPKFSVLPNPNRPGLNNIFYDGRNYDLPVIPDDIREEADNAYRYEFPNGYSQRMHTIPEVIARLQAFVEQMKDGTIADLYEQD